MPKKMSESQMGAIQSSFDNDVQFTLGKLLTIIDSVFGDNRQGKAIKDLVKQVMWKHQLDVNDAIYRIYEVPEDNRIPTSSSTVNQAKSAADLE